ncbi:condensation domain-containing protein, partial [Chryseobacterium sp. NRRL B-14859]|uniref:condensation domain-containing protein n=1 Tax=Chryseobacterium sp. NRRL B-14859 TaxID=1562763 RepID=UPI003399240B
DGAYNIPAILKLSGEVDLSSLRNSYFSLLSRHEILRTVFRENADGEVYQHILTDVFEESFAHLILDFSIEEGNVSEIIRSES